MVWRRRVILTRSSREASSSAERAHGALAAGAGSGGRACGGGALATSSFMIAAIAARACDGIARRPASAIAFFAEGARLCHLLWRRVRGAGAAAGARLAVAPRPSDDGELCACVNGCAFGGDDFSQNACGGAWHFDGDFVGFQVRRAFRPARPCRRLS